MLKAEETYQLNDVVVSASGFEQDLVDAPASISIITKEELEKKPIKDIGEAIGDIPGVDVTMEKQALMILAYEVLVVLIL